MTLRTVVCSAALLAGLLAAAGCGAGGPAPGDAPPPSPAASDGRAGAPNAAPNTAEAAHHRRFQELATTALRLMIAAAQRELPIGPLQERIDAARALATRDVEAAADRMEAIVAELQALLGNGA